jgi:hypothetical protein
MRLAATYLAWVDFSEPARHPKVAARVKKPLQIFASPAAVWTGRRTGCA